MTSSMRNPINDITDEQRTAIITEWLARLRSGKVKQAFMSLRNPETEGRCCLGVLCDVFVETFPSYARWRMEGSITSPSYVFEIIDDGAVIHSQSRGNIPRELAELVGINIRFRNQLVHYNDDLRLPFADIADKIDKHLARVSNHEAILP